MQINDFLLLGHAEVPLFSLCEVRWIKVLIDCIEMLIIF